MKVVTLAIAVLVAGCANKQSPAAANSSLVKFQQKSEEISEREQKCIKAANLLIDDQRLHNSADPDSTNNAWTLKAKDERDRELTACTTTADREKKELAASTRAEYQAALEEERDRATLMSILSTSQQH